MNILLFLLMEMQGKATRKREDETLKRV